jgi:magnesium transporter
MRGGTRWNGPGSIVGAVIRARLDGHLLDNVHTVDDLKEVPVSPGQVLWVHCEVADDAEIAAIATRFHVHPLAVEDMRNINQRPKLDDYRDQLFVVLFGAIKLPDESIALAEVHFLIGDGYLVTVTTDPMPAIAALEKQLDLRPELCAVSPDMVFYRICDSLVDSVFPLLDHIGAQIDAMEDAVLENPDRETLRTIFGLKRDLLTLRRVTGPQRDLLQSLTSPRTPRIGNETQLFLRDVYDHTVRIAEQVDSFRDLVSSSLDAYLTSISNRLGEQTRRLTVVATIFLPLTFLTGFFGMNFAFLIGHIDTPQAFFVGLGVMAVSVPSLVVVVTRLNRRAAPLPAEHRGRRRLGLMSERDRPASVAPSPSAARRDSSR